MAVIDWCETGAAEGAVVGAGEGTCALLLGGRAGGQILKGTTSIWGPAQSG